MPGSIHFTLGAALVIASAGVAHAVQLFDPGSPVYRVPNPDDSYRVMCEKGGLTFDLAGGLLLLDPDTLKVTSVGRALDKTPLGPVVQAPDIPDRYEAARCSGDGGRTWGKVLLDFYVPNFGESSVTNTPVSDALFGETRSDEHYELPDGEAAGLETFIAALQGAIPGLQKATLAVPALPALPSPLYTIDVKYRSPLGYVTASAPGVVGVPSAISLVNYYGASAETLLVQVGPSSTAQSDGSAGSDGYALSVKRVLEANPVNGKCRPLEADVKVRMAIANPADPGYPNNASGTIELGYQTIGVAKTADAPSSFNLKLETAPGDDFLVDVSQVPSCNVTGRLDIVGRYAAPGDPASSADDVDLSLALKMPSLADWTLTRRGDASGRTRFAVSATAPLGDLAITGLAGGRRIEAGVTGLSTALEVCAHLGNRCNQPWRLDRAAETSFYLASRDKAGRPARLGIDYVETDAEDSLDLSLSLSELAYDSYLGRFSLAEVPFPFVHGDYPKWFYVDTGGALLGGHYRSKNANHSLSLEIPGAGTRAWGRELVADKKALGTYLSIDYWGEMTCARGFSILTDIGGKIAGRLLGSAICRNLL